jgi:O-antigen ligase
MLFPIPLVFSLTRHAFGIARVLSVTAAAIMATSIFLSGSRGGMFSFLVQIVFFVLVSIRRKKSFRSMIPLSAFAVIVLGMLIWLGGEQLSHRFATFYTHADSELSSNDRLHIDRDAIKLFSHKPILGFGLGTFSDVYPQFRSFYTNFVVNAAHNDYLQLLVETGILGFGAMLWFLIIVYKRAIVKLEGWTDDTNGAVGLAALLGISGILVHSFVDFNLQIPANAAIFFVLCAIGAMESRFGLHRHRSQLQTDIFSV